MSNNDKYFANDEAESCASFLTKKAEYWFDSLHKNKYLDKLIRSWQFYHGVYFQDSHEINFGGESGELAHIAINHYRNIATIILNIITSSRPAFQARSINTDYKSQVQTKLANGLLEYYMREKRLEKYLKTAAEYAVVLGSGYVKMDWNATSGEIYDYIELDPESIASYSDDGKPLDANGIELKPFPIYQGDVQFSNLSPFDVVFDSTKESSLEHDWVVCRSFKNKHDLAAKFPELKDEILAQKSKSESQKYRVFVTPLDQTVDVPVYEFYHRRTESMPNGRYLMYLSPECVLIDTAMPYRSLPIYRVSAGEILGTPYGYTPMFDLIPIQDAINTSYSIILTNHNAFGVANVLNPRGNDVRVNQLAGGLNFIEYNPVVPGGAPGRPESLNLSNTPKEIFDYLMMLERSMEKISGMSSAVRGDPQASLRSANALAMVQSQSLQFVSSLQQSYIMTIEDVGTGLIQMLQDFASVPRIAEIAGISNRSKMLEFSNKDIDTISRVTVDVGNALAQTTAGRVQMADNMLQMGLITSPENYYAVLNSGRLETMTEGNLDHSLLVKRENEDLIEGNIVVAAALDKHSYHIREHMNVIADPALRVKDQALAERVYAHIMEHVNLLRETDPALLALIGEQPLGPQAGTPPAPGTVAAEQPNQQGMENPELMNNPQAETTQAAPQPPKPTGI